MNEDFSSANSSVLWAEHVRNQLLAAVRKASLCCGRPTPSPEQVHRARRFLKEGNALALLLERAVGAPASHAARQLRSFRRELGDTRDFDVMLNSLDRFAPNLEADLIAELRGEIGDRRTVAAGSAFASGADLMGELRPIAEEARGWRLAAASDSELVLTLKRSYEKARRRGERAFASKLPTELHGLRKALILHRAQSEALEPAWPRLVKAWCSEAQNLRNALGSCNDLSVLSAFVAARAGDRAQAVPLLTMIERAQGEILARAEPIFRRLFCARSKELARQWEVNLASPKKRPKAPSGRSSPAAVADAPDPLRDRQRVDAHG